MTTIYETAREVEATWEETVITRSLRVEPYEDYPDVLFVLLGGVRQVGDQMKRFPPAKDPLHPYCWCRTVRVKGLGVFGPHEPSDYSILGRVNGYEAGAELTAYYRTLDADPAPATNAGDQGTNLGTFTDEDQELSLTSEVHDASVQLLTLSTNRLAWPGGELASNKLVNLSKTLPRGNLALARHFCTTKPLQAIYSQMGRINKSDFVVSGDLYPKETLRFDGAHTERRVTNEGVRFYEIGYQFGIQPVYDRTSATDTTQKGYVGWNRTYRFDQGYWDYLTFVGTSRKIYELDEDGPTQTINGQVVKGFDLLFHPAAR